MGFHRCLYRGLAYVAINMGVDLENVQGLAELTHNPVWNISLEPERTKVYFKNQDVTDDIAHEDVGNFASKISHYPEVRKALLDAQRNCGSGPDNLVAEGRDCGTVVFPDATAKVFLTASSEHRAARRATELGLEQEDMVKAQKQRDHQDSSRKVAPLAIPENAFVVDSTDLTLGEVIDKVEGYVRTKLH